MITAYIGLGSNVGDRVGNISRAIELLEKAPGTRVNRVSRAYESEPAYLEEQPPFVNAVCEIETELGPEALLDHLLMLETDLGRVRERENGPRVIDLDLLLYGDAEIDAPGLIVPHPGLLERDFVVVPLLEIAPRVQLPGGIHPRRSRTTVGRVVRELGPVPAVDEAHNIPIGPTRWVTVAESEWAQDVFAGFDASLQLKRTVLEEEGIPFAYEPFEPGVEMDPFGFQTTFRLVVPVQYESQARTVLGALDEAEILDEAGAEV